MFGNLHGFPSDLDADRPYMLVSLNHTHKSHYEKHEEQPFVLQHLRSIEIGQLRDDQQIPERVGKAANYYAQLVL